MVQPVHQNCGPQLQKMVPLGRGGLVGGICGWNGVASEPSLQPNALAPGGKIPTMPAGPRGSPPDPPQS